jgi:hypothetical protein
VRSRSRHRKANLLARRSSNWRGSGSGTTARINSRGSVRGSFAFFNTLVLGTEVLELGIDFRHFVGLVVFLLPEVECVANLEN